MKVKHSQNVLIPTILCGGVGSRLWPESRKLHPKPFIKIGNNQSLLQKAFIRGGSLHNVPEIVTVTNRTLANKVEKEFEEISSEIGREIQLSFILEPFGRNTAAAVASAAFYIEEKYGPTAKILILAADHLIEFQQEFQKAVNKAITLAENNVLVTFGIKPDSPQTGYGYIEANGNEVSRFIEKPTLEKAKQYIESENFLWNSGMFCFSADSILRELRAHSHDIYTTTYEAVLSAERKIKKEVLSIYLNENSFGNVPSESIDYAVMEKTSQIAVIPCDIGWSDIGDWETLGSFDTPDENGNRLRGKTISLDSENCIVRGNKRLISLIGVEDLIVIDTDDALLIVKRDQTQKVRDLYSQLSDDNILS